MSDIPRSIRIGRFITGHVDPVANVAQILLVIVYLAFIPALIAFGVWWYAFR